MRSRYSTQVWRPLWLLVISVVFCVSVAATSSVFAQGLSRGPVDLQVFRPAIDSKGYTTLNGSQILAPGDFSFGLVSTWARSPLRLEAGEFERFNVENLITTTLTGAIGLVSQRHFGLELGITLPIAIVTGRGLPQDRGPDLQDPNDDRDFTFEGQGLGDIGLHPKIRLSNPSRNKVGVTILPSVFLPTGDDSTFLSEGSVIFQPTAAIDTEFGDRGWFRVALNVGARIRPETLFVDNPNTFAHEVVNPPVGQGDSGDRNTNAGVKLGTEMLAGVALAFGIVPQSFDIVTEVYGAYGPSNKLISDGDNEETLDPYAEALAGIKLYLARNSFFEAGAGWGILPAYGAAERGRLYIGFIFEPSIGDRDGDGYKDDVDQCPDDPEDFDDFEDEDGCPEPDNDLDGILDIEDACPNDPETRNGYEDEDGCPDSTVNDRDGDGIVDSEDKCPDDPEDRDGFEDHDGCPDPDNDRDGILDVDDLCPDDAEDFDGYEDEDGCPEADNDRDRILDVDDQCPDEPETYNGKDDEDGCPDKGRVIVRKGKLEILDKIYFETASDVIKPVSLPLIDAIAATLNGNPQIQLIEVQGHADERGDADYNLDLTERRARSVKRALIERQVDALRLTSRGYGESQPICRKRNEACWSKNRRVEFVILEREDDLGL